MWCSAPAKKTNKNVVLGEKKLGAKIRYVTSPDNRGKIEVQQQGKPLIKIKML